MRYILGFLFAVGLLILVIFLIVRGFTGGGDDGPQVQLIDYAQTDTVMRMTVEGPVNIDQEHRSVTVTVGRSSNEIDLIQGYQGQVLDTRTYPSNEDAYATFLRALDLAGYNNGDTSPENQDSRGFCPTGRVYMFEIITGSSTVQKLWTSSCDGGTFEGNVSVIRELFREQAPDYSDVIDDTRLN